MADDFTGIPTTEYQRLYDRVGMATSFAWLALTLVLLLVFALINRGVLAGWTDLFTVPHG